MLKYILYTQFRLQVLDLCHKIQVLINMCSNSDREQVIQIDDKKSVTVSEFKGNKYVGFSSKSNKCRMNLNVDEFKQLMKIKPDVKSFVKEIMAGKMVKNEDTSNTQNEPNRTILLHTWAYFDPSSGAIIKQSEKWFLDEEICSSEGTNGEPSLDMTSMCPKPEMFVYASEFEIPHSTEELIRLLYIFVIKGKIESLRDTECYACAENRPFHHPLHDEGCCMSWDEAVDKYYQAIFITRPEENVKQLLYIIAENLTGDKDAILKDVSKVENYNWPLSYEIQQWRKNLSKDMQALLLAIE